MSNILLRSWNWCRRFPHRRGYGVHSPSDFFFITFVIYERLPFYAYSPLHHLRRVVAYLPHYREKVDRLLFRISNYLQARNMLEIGTGSGISTRYLAEANQKMSIHTLADKHYDTVERILSAKPNISYSGGKVLDDLTALISSGKRFDLVHIAHTPYYKEVFNRLLPLAHPDTCFIIGHPYDTDEKKLWWKEVVNDSRTGVTFDLYDVGFVFFDKKRVKENRIVNFL